VGLLALFAACGGGGGGGSPPPVTPSSKALIWGSGTWGSQQWSATANAQLATEAPASSSSNPTTTDLVSQEISR
jgi:hypothetical protein